MSSYSTLTKQDMIDLPKLSEQQENQRAKEIKKLRKKS